MGNTKTYYIEGELLPGTTIEQFKEAVYEAFHSTYCVAELVEPSGGYLGTAKDGGPYVVAAIHSYSMRGDSGPAEIANKLFIDLRMHRVDSDWADVWVTFWHRKEGPYHKAGEWRAHDSSWKQDPINLDDKV
jgi:hypothetical protein